MAKKIKPRPGGMQRAIMKELAKKIAYRFGAEAKDGSGITIPGVINALRRKKDYDELKAYLYGPESVGFLRYPETTTGPSHASMVGRRDADEYYGVLNPDGEYVFPERVRPVLEAAADAGSNIYLNADSLPFVNRERYDAANHPLRITRNDAGDIVGSAADIFDFDPKYSKRYDAPWWQSAAMSLVGNPYIVRQDNIPIRFVGEDASEEDRKKAEASMESWSIAETPMERKRWYDVNARGDFREPEAIAIENSMSRAGISQIEPAVITGDLFNPNMFSYSCGGTLLRRYDGGGDIEYDIEPAVVRPNPVRVNLYTDPITRNTPITHSWLQAGPRDGSDMGFIVSKGMDDPTYNLIRANCSDATGEILEALSGQDFTSGITTPYGVRRKARAVFGSYPMYGESGDGTTVQSFYVPWYDYRKAKEVADMRQLNANLEVARRNGASEDQINEIKSSWLSEHPVLPYMLDDAGNVNRYPDGGVIDWNGIATTKNRPYNQEYIGYINDALLKGGMNDYQRASVLANIIEESGGDPFVEGPGGFYGLLQWGSDRYSPTKEKDAYREIDNQVKYILSTAGNATDRKSWTHGGKGSGYNSLKDAMKAYNGDSLEKVMRGYTFGYVRPAGGADSYNNRLKVAQQILGKDGFISYKKGGGIHIDPSKKGTFRAQATKMGMSVKQAAAHILAHKENYSPAMVKKANFARNFAGDGGLLERYGPDRIKEALEKVKRG